MIIIMRATGQHRLRCALGILHPVALEGMERAHQLALAGKRQLIQPWLGGQQRILRQALLGSIMQQRQLGRVAYGFRRIQPGIIA